MRGCLSHGGSSGYARNLSFVAGSVVVGGNPDGGNAKLYVGGTSRYDGLKSFTVGSLTGGGISIDATYGNAQLNLAVQGSGEESAAGNPAAKIYGAVSMVSSGNYKSQFVLFNNESVFSLPVADRFSTLQSYSDAAPRECRSRRVALFGREQFDLCRERADSRILRRNRPSFQI